LSDLFNYSSEAGNTFTAAIQSYMQKQRMVMRVEVCGAFRSPRTLTDNAGTGFKMKRAGEKSPAF